MSLPAQLPKDIGQRPIALESALRCAWWRNEGRALESARENLRLPASWDMSQIGNSSRAGTMGTAPDFFNVAILNYPSTTYTNYAPAFSFLHCGQTVDMWINPLSGGSAPIVVLG